MEKEKVSVVIPAYNCERFVRKSVESILGQTYKNVEVLVADDASTDLTRSIIDSFKDRRLSLHHNSCNLGYLQTVNKLLERSTGDYITFQDADDWSDANRIFRQVSHLKNNGIEICGTGIYQTSDAGSITGEKLYPTDSKTLHRNMYTGMSTVCYASLLFTRKVLDTTGSYRPFFKFGAEDVDWLYRVTDNFKCENINEALYYYRFSDSSITNSVNILRQVASLRFARKLALARKGGQQDLLQQRKFAEAEQAFEFEYETLTNQIFSEDVFKFNQLLRRRSYAGCFRVAWRLLGKSQHWPEKARVILGFILKLLFGMDNYRLLKHRLSRADDL